MPLPFSAESTQAEIASFLDDYPPPILRQVAVLRAQVSRAVPEATDRLRPGWRLIAYDLPITKHGTYFAYIAPEPKHVHLGFAWGTLMSDPTRVLQGAHLHLRRVRYLTYLPGERIQARPVMALIREAARVAALPQAERGFLYVAMSDNRY